VFITGVLSECVNTEGTLIIKGKVLDEGTKTGIPMKNIIVEGLVTGNNKLVPIEAGQFSTDSSGCFTYSLRKVKNAHSYNFSMTGDADYIFTTRTLGLMELKQNSDFLFFSLTRLVDLTIKLTRKSKRPVCDTLRLIWESDGVYGGALYPYKIVNYGRTNDGHVLPSGTDLYWIGGNVNSAISTKVFAGKKTELTWELYRNGKRKVFTDTITCKRDFANIVHFTY
jgi:hypothetical protein